VIGASLGTIIQLDDSKSLLGRSDAWAVLPDLIRLHTYVRRSTCKNRNEFVYRLLATLEKNGTYARRLFFLRCCAENSPIGPPR
jgi:hypothetical protein